MGNKYFAGILPMDQINNPILNSIWLLPTQPIYRLLTVYCFVVSLVSYITKSCLYNFDPHKPHI